MHQQPPNTCYGRARTRFGTLIQDTSFMPDDHANQPAADPDLRRVMKWVFGALILTVAVAILVVEFTLRWFGER
jgi:hypothetical protein